MTHIAIAEARKAMLGITPNLVRISVGIEHADDLIADFALALQAIGGVDRPKGPVEIGLCRPALKLAALARK
jgi:hypothetical protein